MILRDSLTCLCLINPMISYLKSENTKIIDVATNYIVAF